MKILFVGICSSYTDGMTYQDQMMVKQCLADGHETYYISNAQEFKNGVLVDVPESQRRLPNGLHFWQVKYDYILCNMLTEKIRACKKLTGIIESIQPEVIYVHGPNAIAIYEVFKYLKKNPQVKFYVDSHADYYTSGTNWVSRTFLHKLIYRGIYQKCLKFTDKIWCISKNCIKFAEEVYGVPAERIEFYPLGGVMLEAERLRILRERIRQENHYEDDDVIFLQAGKMDEKKCLIPALKEFSKFSCPNWKYVVIGNIADEIKEQFEQCCALDGRIIYLGWRSGDEIMEYLAACDVYMQPGKVSAIAQNAICMGAAVVLRHFEDYDVFVEGNGWLIDYPEQLETVLAQIVRGEVDLASCREKSIQIAKKYLDYEMLTRKIYES